MRNVKRACGEKDDENMISVILPTYNYGKFIEDAIKSVQNQSYSDWELIIVNDGSTDNTAELLGYYPKIKIRIITHEKNRGLVPSCIEAINECAGEYIIRLDADDMLHEHALLIMSNILDIKPEVAIVSSDHWNMNEIGENMNYCSTSEASDIDRNGAGCMFRKSSYYVVGGYNPEIKYADNFDLWLKLSKKFKSHHVKLPLYYYRKHFGSMSSDKKKVYSDIRKVKRRWVDAL